jgi:hypothetical protein
MNFELTNEQKDIVRSLASSRGDKNNPTKKKKWKL